MLSSNIISQQKGDLAVLKTILDLRQKGFFVFREVVNESLPFDLIAMKDNKFYKIQCKYSAEGKILKEKLKINTKRVLREAYSADEVDFFAIYCPVHDRVLYPSIAFEGTMIAYEIRNSSASFYYWKDFLEFTTEFKKRTAKELGHCIPAKTRKPKVQWPSIEQVTKDVFEMPLSKLAGEYGCSNNAIKKYCIKNNIPLPAQGYFNGRNGEN